MQKLVFGSARDSAGAGRDDPPQFLGQRSRRRVSMRSIDRGSRTRSENTNSMVVETDDLKLVSLDLSDLHLGEALTSTWRRKIFRN